MPQVYDWTARPHVRRSRLDWLAGVVRLELWNLSGPKSV